MFKKRRVALIKKMTIKFFNRCFKQIPIGGGTAFGLTTNNFFAADWTGTGCVLVILIFPFWYLGTKVTIRVTRIQLIKFHQMRFLMLNLLHRTGYALLFVVALYEVFRQSRPCSCDIYGTGDFSQVGSKYGMPSGDCLFGALIGWFIVDTKPFRKIPSWVIGIGFIIFKIFERLVLGYHSVGQTISGTAVGSLLYFYSTRVPQYMTYIDNLIMIVLTPILIRIDHTSKYEINDGDNMFAWSFWGACYLIFESICNFRLFHKVIGLKNLKKNYTSIVKAFDNLLDNNTIPESNYFDTDIQTNLLASSIRSDSDSNIQENDRIESETKNEEKKSKDFSINSKIYNNFAKKFEKENIKINVLKEADVWITVGAFFIGCVVMYVSFLWQIYAW
ncbi:hypothetical protein M0813_15996 [Anaeramoeba flamelloides]|uniref:Phosphatidic acid phosphatase type 2/haloperoxidase domain-containing protein n=1 Tax=Anaeramoeba flamelloides TaxID=1746091 RepID=A0ABQ8Z1A4_9EUKA|nr:hypothetical protein M0813_15996 [Anaeramoeba flamelloides]